MQQTSPSGEITSAGVGLGGVVGGVWFQRGTPLGQSERPSYYMSVKPSTGAGVLNDIAFTAGTNLSQNLHSCLCTNGGIRKACVAAFAAVLAVSLLG